MPPTLLAVSGHGTPRWLLPPRGDVGAVLGNWAPYRLASRLNWRCVQAGSRCGLLGLLPNVQTFRLENINGIDWRALGWSDVAEPLPLVYVGTPSSTRKAVLHLVDPGSRSCRVIVKVPLTADAKTAIVHEAKILSRLASEVYPGAAPRLVSLDRKRGITTQSFIAGRPGRRDFRPEYANLLRCLVLVDEHTRIAGHAGDHTRAVEARKFDRQLIEAAQEQMSDARDLPACWVHGDFAPWNIRERTYLAPALIDWEDAERGGLPLQDGYHFLHMQDFLFGTPPTSHHADLEMFGRNIGVAPGLCRKLEVAYLLRSYFSCLHRGEDRRAAFMLRALAIAMPARRESSQPRLKLVSSRPANAARMRAELFSSVITTLNAATLRYCVLSGYENDAGSSASDVDIMVHPRDLPRVPQCLAQAARSQHAVLAQAMQHETSATYFVLARQQGSQLVHLDIDCYGDYRRDGRTWMPAGPVVANRRRYGDFYLPAVGDEFQYYLIKKILKQSVSDQHLKSLQVLFARDPLECRYQLQRYWPGETAELVEAAIVMQDLAWCRRNLPKLLCQLHRSQPSGDLLTRCTDRLRDMRRLMLRVLSPTGALISIAGGGSLQRTEVADALLCRLAPLFRHTRRVLPPVSFGEKLRAPFQIMASRLRSTLLVSTVDPQRQHILAAWPAVPDVLVLLSDGDDGRVPARHTFRLHADSSVETLVTMANQHILSWLSARAASRLKLADPRIQSPAEPELPPMELEPVGSD